MGESDTENASCTTQKSRFSSGRVINNMQNSPQPWSPSNKIGQNLASSVVNSCYTKQNSFAVFLCMFFSQNTRMNNKSWTVCSLHTLTQCYFELVCLHTLTHLSVSAHFNTMLPWAGLSAHFNTMLPWADLSLHTLAQSVSAHFNTMLPWADQWRFCQAADCSAFDELHVSSTHCHVAGEQSSKKKIQTSDKTAGTLYSEAAQSNNQKYRLLTKQLVHCILKLHKATTKNTDFWQNSWYTVFWSCITGHGWDFEIHA